MCMHAAILLNMYLSSCKIKYNITCFLDEDRLSWTMYQTHLRCSEMFRVSLTLLAEQITAL